MNDSTIYELFQRNPVEYSPSDIDSIIEKFREKRKNFDLTGTSAKVEADPKKSKAKKEMQQLSLDIKL